MSIRTRKKADRDSPGLNWKQSVDDHKTHHLKESGWFTENQFVLVGFLFARVISVVLNNLNDCDETFNYWEPSHFLLYKNGLQTWEYSPSYAIRSYAYLWLYIFPSKLFMFIGLPKILIFYLTRCYIASICVLSELFLYRSITKTFNSKISRLYFVISIFSPGLFQASTSFLPSSFGMYMTCLAFGSWFLHYHKLFIFFTAFSAIIGWPFTAAISLPMAVYLFVNKRYTLSFVSWSLIIGTTVLVPTVIVDSYYYGKFVFSSLNIILYNVFSLHGPDLYGTEPFSYYLINLFLNFNLVSILAYLSLPVFIIFYLVKSPRNTLVFNQLFVVLSLFLWFGIFFLQSHKEERFIYPIYPLICLAASFTIYNIEEILGQILPKFKQIFNLLMKFCIIVFIVLSLSRIAAIYKGYNASLTIYHKIWELDQNTFNGQNETTVKRLCLGKEWHRFPSNFFIPKSFKIEFIRSEFRGQLPKHYDTLSEYPSRAIPTEMNDQNKEEPSRYIDQSRCTLIIDSDYERFGRDLSYSRDNQNWLILHSLKYLDSSHSSKLFRSFYIPYLSQNKCTYINYNLLLNRNL